MWRRGMGFTGGHAFFVCFRWRKASMSCVVVLCFFLSANAREHIFRYFFYNTVWPYVWMYLSLSYTHTYSLSHTRTRTHTHTHTHTCSSSSQTSPNSVLHNHPIQPPPLFFLPPFYSASHKPMPAAKGGHFLPIPAEPEPGPFRRQP